MSELYQVHWQARLWAVLLQTLSKDSHIKCRPPPPVVKQFPARRKLMS